MVAKLTGPEPQPVYVEYAARCPVTERAPGWFLITQMQDCVEINRSRSVIGDASTRGLGGDQLLIPLDLDGPLHTQYRKLLDPVFAPKKLAPLEDKIRSEARVLLDGFAGLGEVEAFDGFCQPLPSRIFLSILGLPLADLPLFLEIKDGVLRFDFDADPADIDREQEVARQLCFTYFGSLWDARNAAGDLGDDLVGWIMGSSVDGHALTRDDFNNIMLLMIVGGLDTITASMSLMLSWLARNPEHRRWILEDASRWPLAIEEMLRMESPSAQGFRQAVEDVEINGRVFPAGSRFLMSWPSINLDPKTFENPLETDLERSPNPHVAFANGWHRCLGSHLARLEIRIALEEFHARIPDYEIKPGVELEYLPLGVRQVRNLPLVW